ncbi:Rrf2 family transcriptional regulator [Butyricicoccus sp.]|uniref:Rrf2 family transcriptional regulator n=1 Tax=Butyricicoccus sp. TaxID=2049021 RepID=UPI003F1407F2
MQFSSRLPIAVHILLCIVAFDGKYKTTSSFLADSVNVNPVIIRKTLGQLRDAGLVHVEAGVGGASLAKEPADITLLDIFDAVECADTELFRFHENPNPACPVGRTVHAVLDGRLADVRRAMEDSLRAVTLQSLIDDMEHKLGT